MTNRVVIVGSGAWGTTLAGLAALAGSEAILVARNPDVHESLLASRRHPVSLPGYRLPGRVDVLRSMDEAISRSPTVVVIAVPSRSIGDVATQLDALPHGTPIVTATKGLDPESLMTPVERLSHVAGRSADLAVLSGPNLAGEIASGLPAAAVVASQSPAVAERARAALMSTRFRIYTATDVIGVEIAGAYKNVIAIGAGIADGLGAGHNAKAAYITRGIAELVRLGVAHGANPMTFAGLAGIGDVIATCSSERSRNHTVGRRLAAGESIDAVLGTMPEVAEGVPTTRAVLRLADRYGIELPIAAQVARMLFEGASPNEAIAALMAREPTAELAFLDRL